ncbi:elongation factor G [Romboutsia lituseburensis]|uniref:Translation elongation factor 2 (EF-2/EF-G) n=1 Tax=Romboutsia lituseburensis DSM 797 TaxID=1121325 RepID=A0A1G9UFQ5_9FIRM|nr:elongation factor G [Romboutsia lituseburensis]CEH36081.1 Elongation factor G [Romboutsia lituseburensis]SDM58355.1 translation elongation factor 2 (EF-2/EF-G) [Romboutsia lituseburensis DSM 797]
MKVYESNMLRNIAILGHSGCGKTNLIDAIAYTSNLTNKIPKINDKVNMTYSMGLTPVEYNGYKYNLLDTPGYFDFSGDVISSLKASDAAIIVIDATTDIQVGTEKSLELTNNIPKIMFINKIDNEKARYKDTLAMLRETYGNKVVPMIIPIYKNKQFIKLHNVFENMDDLEGEFKDEAISVKEALMELIAETDDEILDKYFNGEELTAEEIQKGITIGMQQGDIIPVICGSTINNIGTGEILETVSKYLQPRYNDSKNKFKGQIFKTMVDPFIGKMSYLKVTQGKISKDTEVFNINKSVKDKIYNLYTMRNNELLEVESAECGDIVILTKTSSLQTGDTISLDKDGDALEDLGLPKPQIYYAVVPKNKGDEDKVAVALNKIAEEDPTIVWYRNSETKQALVGGQGELHINTAKNKMREKFGVDVELEDLKVAYRETIKGCADVQGKHKKQSGGRGQYGDVKIKFEKSKNEFEFAEALFGGSVPRQYVPAVEKGLKDSMTKGILAGFPVINIKATLYDGSYHDVDSSEMAFKLAANLAFKKGMEEAQPVLLEPIMKLKITVPENYMGDVMGDINKRRGKILGMEPYENGKQVIYAYAPQAETFKYAIDLRAMTQGRGYFEMELESYEEVPNQIAQKIIEDVNNK